MRHGGSGRVLAFNSETIELETFLKLGHAETHVHVDDYLIHETDLSKLPCRFLVDR